jgi:pre-mRNA-splicing factor ATP-dependent RNA helicase DHX15/PRP43
MTHEIKNVIEDNDLMEEEAIIETSTKKRDINVDKVDLFDKIGILDPEERHNNPLTNEPYKNLYYDDTKEMSKENFTYKSLSKAWTTLPMYSIREKSIKAIHEHQVVLVVSGTGSGKTVLIPKYALHALNYQGRIAITNPKKVPTAGNAVFAAKTLDVKLGESVGYRYSNRGSTDKTKANPYSEEKSKLMYCTDGILLAFLKGDPYLSNLDCVIIDEAHERGVNIDLLLLLLKKLLLLRPDFKLVIMSATINAQLFVDYFPKKDFKFAIIEADGAPNKPVTEFFLDDVIKKIPSTNVKTITYNTEGSKSIIKSNGEMTIQKDDMYLENMIKIILYILQKSSNGDVLAFVGGLGAIQNGCRMLRSELNKLNPELSETIFCCELHGAVVNTKDEPLILNEHLYKEGTKYTRKVVFSTEVAESSVTIDGLVFVVDSGIAHSSRFYTNSNTTALEKRFIPKSSHMQRKGRVGRTQPGVCFNLFTKNQYKELFQDYATPPIHLNDLSTDILGFISKYIKNIQLPFKYPKNGNGKLTLLKDVQDVHLSEFLFELIEPPKEKDVQEIISRLIDIDCLEVNEDGNIATITMTGKACSKFLTSPELSRMIVSGYNHSCLSQMTDFIAFMDFKRGEIKNLFNPTPETLIKTIQRNADKLNMSKSKIQFEIKAVIRKFETILKKFASQYGDIASIINVLQQYRVNKQGINDRKTDRVIKEKMTDEQFTNWIQTNSLSSKNLKEITKNSEQLQRQLRQFISNSIRDDPTLKKATIFFKDNEIKDISRINEENIFKSIVDGLLVNVFKKDKNQYSSCYASVSSKNSLPNNISPRMGIELNTFLPYIKNNSEYVMTTELKSFFANTKFNMITLIPSDYIERLKTDETLAKKNKILSKCIKPVVVIPKPVKQPKQPKKQKQQKQTAKQPKQPKKQKQTAKQPKQPKQQKQTAKQPVEQSNKTKKKKKKKNNN